MRKITSIVAMSIIATSSLLASDSALGVKANTLGVGLEYSHKIFSNTALRVSAQGFKYSANKSYSNIDFDGDLQLATAGLIADFHPFENGFRVSGGAYYNANKLTLDGKPTGGTYTINNVVYNATDVASLNGKTDFNQVAPYVGLGYDASLFNSGSFFFTAEAGVMYQGSTSVSLTSQCGPTASAATCSSLQSNTAAQENQLNDDLSAYKWWPVLSLGVSYKF